MYTTTPSTSSYRSWARRFAPRLTLTLALTAAFPVLAADTGTITGAVINTQTSNLLEGARVEIPRLNLSVLTDNIGRYAIPNVPAGSHEVVARYIGLDPLTHQVNVAAGERSVRDFELTSAVYKLDAFKVTGEREGNAAMITEKKNADNVKDIIAMDSFGYLPNMSAGEVVMRLPGVAGSPTDEGLAYRFNMRGMDPTLNNVTVDGASMTTLGTNRSFELQSITGSMFDALELIKGHTPDKDAASLGGTINFKTRATFTMREKRRTTYNFSTRWAAPFFEQTPLRSQHRAHPILQLTHQEVFDVFGQTKNLGVTANLFYSENAVGGFANILDYMNVANGPAPIWDYQTWDNINNRKQMSLNLKADYRLGPNAKISIGVTGNDNFERMRRRVTIRAFTGSATTALSNTTGIVPGAFDENVTVVRPIAANNIDVTMDGPLNYYVRMRRADLNGDWARGNLSIEYGANIATTHLNNGNGRGGTLNMRLGSVNPATGAFTFGGAGWIIDKSRDSLFPDFRKNGGPDFTDPANYRPRNTDGLVQQRNQNDQLLRQARVDVRYRPPFVVAPTNVKFGYAWRDLNLWEWTQDRHRWSYLPTGPALAHDPNYVSYERTKTGRAIPMWQAHMHTVDGRPKDPSVWIEDLYFNEQQKFTNTRTLREKTPAYYVMAQGRLGREGFLGRTGYLGGYRFEQATTEARGFVRGRTLSTPAQRAADPVGSARSDYAGNHRVLEGDYKKKFPSLHAFHDLTKDFKVRASYSTSYGRPPLGNLLPGETPNENLRTVTVNNPGLQPYTSTNWDATLEYYFEPVGSLTVGWFHKDIRGFIFTTDVGTIADGIDNGYGGEYVGWTERTQINGGAAIAQGWEFAYQQQFTFLPGLLKTLSASFNYTWIETHGTRNGTRYLTRREVTSFIPHAANAALSWRYRKFNARVLYNFTGEHITAFNATNPELSQYRFSMKTVNLGLSYAYRPWMNFSVDLANAFNEPQRFYIGYKDRVRRTIVNFVPVTISMNGRF